ncbi:DUF4426 domain-containing protein [Lysobacter sp. D1-1-M9]|uniref:DUF4426 domain-containing protein n=1 Tax=Novilysobacter longmucuonensis TaxID=3098603 RepID=UPI002FCAA1C0
MESLSMPSWARSMRRAGCAVLLTSVAAVAGCGREPSAPSATASHANATQQEATSRVGDVSIRASVAPTAMIGEAVAAQYGLERDENTVLLLVGVRLGPEAQETALPARITATATDLRGVSQGIEMREVRNGDLVDYVGTARVAPPDTLRFDLTIVREGGARSTMQFSRDIFPR